MADVEIIVADDPARDVAERLALAARAGGHISLTGGTTPKLAYELAATLEPDWTRTEIWWGDERCSHAEDPESNYGMAKTALLDHVRVGPVHRMRGELGKDAGATQYEEELNGLQRFALMLLGMGPDGHVASLYPNQPTLDVTDRRVIGAEAHLAPWIDRITLTLPMLRAADEVLFLISGEDKAEPVRRAFAEEPSHATPASLVRGTRTVVVLDAAAAALL